MQPLTSEPPPFNVIPPPGGTATFFQNTDTLFGFDFTGFNNGETFSFDWDPDIAGDLDYGARVIEQVGTLITLVTAGGTVSGTLQIDPVQDNLVAVIESPATGVPEPGSLALLGAALAGFAFARRRVSRRAILCRRSERGARRAVRLLRHPTPAWGADRSGQGLFSAATT